jgi:mRNA interferase MazF
MKEGDFVLTSIPQADGILKNRPAIILREMLPYRDFLVCGVSIQLDKQVKGFDDVISAADDDFKGSGLRTTSLVRLGFLAVLPSAQIIGAIESISPTRHQRLLKTVSDYLIDAKS